MRLDDEFYPHRSYLYPKKSWSVCVITTLMAKARPSGRWSLSWWPGHSTSTATEPGKTSCFHKTLFYSLSAISTAVTEWSSNTHHTLCWLLSRMMHFYFISLPVIVAGLCPLQWLAAGTAGRSYDLRNDPHCQPGARWCHWRIRQTEGEGNHQWNMGWKEGKRDLNRLNISFPPEWMNRLFLFQAILAGDFILSAASMALARIGNITVVKVLSQVIEDLVRGMITRFFGSF